MLLVQCRLKRGVDAPCNVYGGELVLEFLMSIVIVFALILVGWIRIRIQDGRNGKKQLKDSKSKTFRNFK
jgi:hypothetical protein